MSRMTVRVECEADVAHCETAVTLAFEPWSMLAADKTDK